MSGADVFEVGGLLIGLAGVVVFAYGLWLVTPALMLVLVGLGALLAGGWMVWFGNRGPS